MGGGIFTLGSVLVLSVGLPEARRFILGAALAAVPVAGVLAAWHRLHRSSPQPWGAIRLNLRNFHPNPLR